MATIIRLAISRAMDAAIRRSRDHDGTGFMKPDGHAWLTDTIGTETGFRRVARRSIDREQSYEQHVPLGPAMVREGATAT